MRVPFESLTAQTYLDFDIPKNFITSRTHTTAKSCSCSLLQVGQRTRVLQLELLFHLC